MKVTACKIQGLYVIEPQVFGDERGYFFESFSEAKLKDQFDLPHFVQDNESKSVKGVLRGLHYQMPPHAQSKLVRVVQGEVLDVAVDIRKGSPTFGQHEAVLLSAENKKQFLIPKGFAHAFLVLSEEAIFQYKVDAYWDKDSERSILWNDPELGIDWPELDVEVNLSEKDAKSPLFKDADYFTLGEEG